MLLRTRLNTQPILSYPSSLRHRQGIRYNRLLTVRAFAVASRPQRYQRLVEVIATLRLQLLLDPLVLLFDAVLLSLRIVRKALGQIGADLLDVFGTRKGN